MSRPRPKPNPDAFPCCPRCSSLDIAKGPPGKCHFCGWDFAFPAYLNRRGERIGSVPTPRNPEDKAE